jgi:capsular exopolysaccharide synthesis family protein
MAGVSELDPAGSYGPGLLRSMWRYRYGIAATTVVMVLAGYFVSTLLTPVYETTATIVLADEAAFGADTVADPERQVQQEANRLASRAVFNTAARKLGGGIEGDSLRQDITVQADPAIGVLEVHASSDDPEAAARVANTVVEAYQQVSRQATTAQVESAVEVLRQQETEIRDQITELEAQQSAGQDDGITQQRIDSLENRLVSLETTIGDMEADAALFGSGVEEVEAALPPSSPTTPKPLRNAAIAGVVGAAIVSALAYWRAGVVDSSKLDPSLVLGAPLLAEIPEFKRSAGVSRSDPLLDMEAAEAYQFLLASFEFALTQSGARSVLVTSAFAGDGKSLTSLHLARALAVQGRKVMLVDSDIRARGLTSLLRAEEHPGLVALARGADLNDVVRQYRISQSVRLPVIPAGQTPHQLTGLLATDSYREAIAKITTNSELTIIDGGPLLTVADASAVAAQVAGILLVIDARMSSDDLYKVHERLRLISTPVLGYVLNRVADGGKFVYPYGMSEHTQRSWIGRILLRSGAVRRPVTEILSGA